MQLSARGGNETPALEVLGSMLPDEEFNPFSPESGSLADASRHGNRNALLNVVKSASLCNMHVEFLFFSPRRVGLLLQLRHTAFLHAVGVS